MKGNVIHNIGTVKNEVALKGMKINYGLSLVLWIFMCVRVVNVKVSFRQLNFSESKRNDHRYNFYLGNHQYNWKHMNGWNKSGHTQ